MNTILHTFQPSENKAFLRENGSLSRIGYISVNLITVIKEWTNEIGKFIRYKYNMSFPEIALLQDKPVTPIVELEPITLDSPHKWINRYLGNEKKVHTWKIHQDTKIGVAFSKELGRNIDEVICYTEDLIIKQPNI